MFESFSRAASSRAAVLLCAPVRSGHRLLAAAVLATAVAACDTGKTVYGDPSQPDHLAFQSQPDSAVAGVPIGPLIKILVLDANGNRVHTDSIVVTITSNARTDSSFLYGKLTATTVDGIATFDSVFMKRVGPGFQLAATAPHLAGAVSDSFAVKYGAAAKLDIEAVPVSVVAGDTIKPFIRVVARDQFGNDVPTYDKPVGLIIFANPAGGTLRGTSIVSAVGGVATFNNVNINRVGSGYVLRALDVAGSLAPGNSNTFAVTPSVPTQLFFTINPPATVTANDTIRPPMEVTVVDSLFNTVTTASVPITIAIANKPPTAPGSGATLGGTLTVTSINGVAQFKSVYFSIPGLTTTASPFRLGASSAPLTPALSSFFSAIP